MKQAVVSMRQAQVELEPLKRRTREQELRDSFGSAIYSEFVDRVPVIDFRSPVLSRILKLHDIALQGYRAQSEACVKLNSWIEPAIPTLFRVLVSTCKAFCITFVILPFPYHTKLYQPHDIHDRTPDELFLVHFHSSYLTDSNDSRLERFRSSSLSFRKVKHRGF